MRPRPILLLALGIGIGVLAMAGIQRLDRADRSDRNAAGVLAIVGDVAITEEDFLGEMERRGGVPNFTSPEARRQLLEDMIRLGALSASARLSGYEDDPSVRREVEYVLAGKYRQEHLESDLANVSVSDEEVADLYRRNEGQFVVPAAAHVAILYFEHPLTAPDDVRRRTLERAARARVEALKQPGDEHFGELAVRHSDDQASRYRGGDVGWLAEGRADGRFDDAVRQTALALAEPGALSEPISTPKGVYLVRLLERRESSMRPLEEVAAAIHQRLMAAKQQQVTQRFVDAAIAKVGVQVNEERLAAIELPEPVIVEHVQRPPPLPQG